MQRYEGRHLQGEMSQTNPQPQNTVKTQETSMVNMLKDIAFMCLSNWYWFVLSILVALGFAKYYLLTTPPTYQRNIAILLKKEPGEGESMLKELGLSGSSANLNNEMELMKTSPIAYEIAKRLDLNVEYIKKGTFHDEVLYGDESPVKVSFLTLGENENASFNLHIGKNGEVGISDIAYKGREGEGLMLNFNDTVETPMGKILVTPTSSYKNNKEYDLFVKHSNIKGMVGRVQNRITPVARGKGTTIIDISYVDVSKKRAEDILNTLIGVYNENWIKDRNLQTTNTDKFIRERLSFIEDELGDVEQDISVWKSRNLMLDVDAAGSFAQNQANEAEREMQELDNQIYMTKYIKDYLTDGQHANQLLPVNSGITNSSIEGLITKYNNVLLNRNSHLANSSAQNPLVKDLDEDLANLRGSILQSLDYELTMLQSKTNAVRSKQGLAFSRIATNPQKAQQLLSVERQQKVKEQLYLFLLEKREENELNQAFGAYNNQFIESAHGGGSPIAPLAQKAYMIAATIGLMIPLVIIFLTELFNTSVRGRKDLSVLSAPYIGDIPLHVDKSKKKSIFKKTVKEENPVPVVAEKKRDPINEAFRVIRTNIEFMVGFNKRHQVIMLTSLTPGSGKTFITMNLATAESLKGLKVLAIDLDLRKRSLSKYVGNPKRGVSNFLSGQVTDYKECIKKLGNVDVLPCGSLPPNPAELLFSPKFKELIDEVKESYDYVFLDCPPVEMIADTSIISQYSDLTLFVVRIGKLQKDMLPDIEEWYHNGKYGKLAILLNGVESGSGRYGYHKYGYHKYGYHYGSSYGYGPGEEYDE